MSAAARATLVLLSALVWTHVGRAEMDASDYQVNEFLRSAAEREQVRRVIEAEIEAEQARSERIAADERDAGERIAAERAARPRAIRLIEERCSRCHGDQNITDVEAGWLGWQWIILRMQWINGATLLPGERDVLATHFANAGRAGSVRVFAEYAGAGLMAVVAVSAIVAGALQILTPNSAE